PAERLAVPDVLVLEQAAGSKRLLVVGVDDVDGMLREQVGGSFADDLLARHAELFGSDAVGEQITAIARILHRDLRRYVIEDLTEEGVVAVALLLEPLPLGDVLHGRNPSAPRQRLVDDVEGPAVLRIDDRRRDLAASNAALDFFVESVGIAVERTRGMPVPYDVQGVRAGFDDVGGQPEHV